MTRIERDLDAAEYHASPAVGSSGLKDLARSPLHYWSEYVDPDRRPRIETPAMRTGTLVHLAVLEPERYASDVAIAPECDRRTKIGKETWAEFQAANLGKFIITEGEAEAVESIARAVRAHPMARYLIEGAACEQSIFWADEETGIECRGRFDAVSSGGVIIDLKKVQDARPKAFERSIVQYGYHLQAAHYLDGFRAVIGEPKAYLWIAVEEARPHGVAVYAASADMLERGFDKRRELLRTLAECRATNTWPGYPVEITEINLPAWA